MLDYKKNAKKFLEYWKGKGYEKGETSRFWISLLQDVYGVENPAEYILFEEQVQLKNKSFIDAVIPTTKVMIEQKSIDKDLKKATRQSDGEYKTPYEQAKRYSDELPISKKPRWIIISNFKEFHIHDMERPHDEPEIILLENLDKEYHRMMFLVDEKNENIQKEKEVSLKAGELVGILYDNLLKQYKNPEDEETLKNLNILCVRIVFCLYAEDAGIFGRRNMFFDYLEKYRKSNFRQALINLFKILDEKAEERDPYIEEELAEFPYVNGGLFADDKIIIPRFTDEIISIILDKASADFDWSNISPTIFGGVFESTLNPETRRTGGMHYTSIENIHKVINPLFMEELENEFEEIKNIKILKTRDKKLREFQERLSKINFLDPACGSGNFLTETYISLRRLENKIIKILEKNQMIMGDIHNPVKISIGQFYGIEINDFAVTVAKTALWIAESQMLKETQEIIQNDLDFLPLVSYPNIIEGNALKMDWNEVVAKEKINYIIGNPPFLGGMYMSKIQKEEIKNLFTTVKGVGEFDYVTGWYFKAINYIENNFIKCAFVSTNSICQGSQVITFWKYLFEKFNIEIDFAYQSFIWNNETKNQAKVHCVIVGFSKNINKEKIKKKLFLSNNQEILCEEISPYLTDTNTIFIESRSNPLCNIPKMKFGSMPRDGGNFVLSKEEKEELEKKEPLSKKWIKFYIGATEFLNNKERYCLWLIDVNPSELQKCPTVLKRIEQVKEFRKNSKAEGTRKFAETPTVFCQIAQPDTDYIIVPKTSSGKRKYIPLGFKDKETIASDSVFLIPNAKLYEFSILMSNVHNAWMRTVAGRLKSDYRYSKDIVYNNFPFPKCNEKQKEKIEKTAQGILDARNLYPESSLADLYNELTMPKELRKAHQENDKAVMEAYGFDYKMSESECVAELFKLYESLVGEKK